jgi:GTP pyrophosphokinase
VTVEVVSANRPGILASISSILANAKVNISEAHSRALDSDSAINVFQFAVQDLSQLKSLIRSIQRVAGVHSVERR